MRILDRTRLRHRTINRFPASGRYQCVGRYRFPCSLISVLFLLALFLAFTASLRADTLSGTVKDPSGAVVSGARIELAGGNLTQPLALTSDSSGKFTAPDLAPGKYSIRVTKTGFEELSSTVDLHGTADLPLTLTIATQQAQVTVTDKSLAYANSDLLYRQLRDDGLGDSFHCENFKLNMDVATIELKSGTITLVNPINKMETGMIFVGTGHFSLKPVLELDTKEMVRRAGSPTAEEDFTEAVFRFNPNQYNQLAGALGSKAETPAEAVSAFQHWKERVRHRHESPEGLTQAFFENEMIDNVDADILSAVYNPHHPAFVNLYMHGSPHKDLRFFLRARVGAIPQLDSAEEVALVNFNGGGMDDGIFYAQHLKSELQAHTANSREDRRLFATKRYNIETVIGKNDHLFASATITFEPLVPGERVLKFGLLPTLRVVRVADQNGNDLHFIQENRKQDGSFYAVLDQAPPMGQEHSITVDYMGDKVLYDAGGGSYYVGARESWYPNLNGFGEKALYDLAFKVPHNNVVISVGKLEKEYTEAGIATFHWVTPVPVAVAGFNYGQYQKIDFPDDITHYKISGYYLTELPANLKRFQKGVAVTVGPDGHITPGEMSEGALAAMAPGAMTKYALDQARAQMQLCSFYFGKGPYENISITEQPNFSFGQSWPNLVYLPISAYIDSTQRWMMFGQIDAKFSGFVQEVTPHEVAHQWFGHGVSWASYHDLWLSEGFADFAAALFLQQAVGPKWQKDYITYWQRQHDRILEKNAFGISPNDAGPLWLGERLISPRSANAYQSVTYSKGAYVLSMLRSIMYDDNSTSSNREQAFIDMMHDFMDTHRNVAATTESFKAIAEKHMTKQMDLQRNGRLDWFFKEWVYSTQVPRYSFSYESKPDPGGKTRVHVELTQSEVDENFAMFVPVFGDFGKGMIRLGQFPIIGNSTRKVDFVIDQEPKKVVINAYKDILER